MTPAGWVLLPMALSLFFVPFFRGIGIRYRLFDDPGSDPLKIHARPIPYLGGAAVFVVSSLSLAIIFVSIMLIFRAAVTAPAFLLLARKLLEMVLAGLLIIMLGLADDWKWKKSGSPYLKLFFQFLAGFLVIFILAKQNTDFEFTVAPVFGALVAGVYIVGSMNAMNMEDGMDGLAGGLSAISLIGFFALSIHSKSLYPMMLSSVLFGSVLGFLNFNRRPASIFLGDNGSHFLGFALAVFAITFTNNPLNDPRRFIGPILVIGMPVFDCLFAIVRRTLKGKSPFYGDRSHFYDLLNQRGAGVGKTVLICYGIQSIIVAAGVLLCVL